MKPLETHSSTTDWVFGVQKKWSHPQMVNYLRKLGLDLSAVDQRQTEAESFITSLTQHLTGQYSSLFNIENAVNFVLNKNSEKIRFRIQITKERYHSSKLDPFITNVLSLMHRFCGESNFLSSNAVITVFSSYHEIVRFDTKGHFGDQVPKPNDLFVWQDGTSGRFSCITQMKNTFTDENDYILALLRDIGLIRDLIFHHLELVKDENVENAVDELLDKITLCQSARDYLAAINQCKFDRADKWKLLALEQLADVAKLSEDVEHDLKDEIIDCLVRASEDTYLRRKHDYETECRNDIENQNLKERQNRDLEDQTKAAEEEITQLESIIKDAETKEIEAQKALEQLTSNLKEKKDQEQNANQLLNQKQTEYQHKLEDLKERKSEVENIKKRLEKEECTSRVKAKVVAQGIQDIQQQMHSVTGTMQSNQAQMEDETNSIAELQSEQRRLNTQEKELEFKKQYMKDGVKSASQLLKSNQTKIQEKKQQKAWLDFQMKLSKSIPPYKIIHQKASFIKRVNSIDKLSTLFSEIIDNFELQGINHFDLKSYAENLGITRESIQKKVVNIVLDQLTEPKTSFVRSPWRVSGCSLLLSEIKNEIIKMSKNRNCEEIHICASKIIYIDCDLTLPETTVALSSPNIKVVGVSTRQIDISGSDATEFHDIQASHAKRMGENGDHGRCGQAGKSAGHFFISCDNLTGGQLIVKANGGKGADGQNGGDGKEGTNGTDGKDGEITNRPSEGIGFWNVGFRSKESLLRFDEGKDGTPGKSGGNGGSGGAGGDGGFKGIVTQQISTGNYNFISVAKDGQRGRDGTPGKGAGGGIGGRNGRDRALAFKPSYNSWNLGFSGDWYEECGDLTIHEMRGKAGTVHGYRIEKKGTDKGRASRGKQGQNGQNANQSQRQTARAKQQMTNVQQIWSNDKTQNDTSQLLDTSTDCDAEISLLKASNNQIEDKITELELQEQNIKQRLCSVEQQKGNIDREKLSKSSNLTRLQEDTSQLEEEKRRIQEKIEQEKRLLKEHEQKVQELKFASESRKVQAEQLARSQTELEIKSTKDIKRMKANVSSINEQTKKIEEKATKTLQMVDSIKQKRGYDEKMMQQCQQQSVEYSKMMLTNKISMEESLQHRIQTEEKLQNLTGLEKLKDKIKKIRVVQQHRVERLAPLEDVSETSDDDESLPITDLNAFPTITTELDSGIFQLLDDLIEKNAALSLESSDVTTMNKSTLLASLSQQTAMLLTNRDTWPSSLTSILYESQKDIDSTIQALECINADLHLVQLINASKDETTLELIQCFRRFVVDNLGQQENCDVAIVFYHFRRLQSSTTEQQILDLLKKVEKIETKSKIGDRLKCLLSGRLFVSISNKAVGDLKNQFDIRQVQLLLADVLDYRMVADPTATMTSFFSKLIKLVDEKKTKNKTWIDLQKLFVDFALDVLSINLGKKTWANKINREKVFFILKHVHNLNPEQFDKLHQWSIENDDDEMTNHIRHVFDEHHWNPIWIKIRSVSNEGKWMEEVNRLEKALQWEHSPLSSYQQIMQACSTLEEKLRTTAQGNPDDFIQWMHQQEAEISGYPFENEKELKSSYLQFFRQLMIKIDDKLSNSAEKQGVKEKLSVWGKSVVSNFSKTTQPPEEGQMLRRALYIYDKIHFDSITEIKELNGLLENINAKIKSHKDLGYNSQDLTNLIAKHRKNWVANYLDRWIANRKKLDESFIQKVSLLKSKIQEKTCWLETSNRHNVPILLSKYLLVTSRSSSPSQSFHIWESLEKMKITEPDKLQEELGKRASTNSAGMSSNLCELNEFLSKMDIFVNHPEDLDVYRTLEQVIKTQFHWTELEVVKIDERLPHWNSQKSAHSNKMVQNLLQWLTSGEDLVQEISLAVEANYLEHARAIDSFYQSILQMVSGLQDVLEYDKKDTYHNNIADVIAHLEDEPTMLNVSSIPEKIYKIFQQYVGILTKLVALKIHLQDPVDLITTLLELPFIPTKSNEEIASLLRVIAELCNKLELKSADTAEHWISLLERIDVSSSNDLLLLVQQIQHEIIKLVQSFCLTTVMDSDDLTIDCEHCMDNLAIVSRFLAGNSEYEANQLLLRGLLILTGHFDMENKSEPLKDFMREFIEQVKNTRGRKVGIKTTDIVSFIYSPSSTPIEATFLKYWIQSEASKDTKKVRIIFDLVKDKENENKINRFWDQMEDIWSSNQKRYVDIIGLEAAKDLLRDQTPVNYLHLLQVTVLNQIYDKLRKHFNSDADSEDLKKFQLQFRESYSKVKQEKLDYEWIVWLNNVVKKSLQTSNRLSMDFVTRLFSVTENHSFNQLLHTTMTSRPHQWLDNLLISSVVNAACAVFGDKAILDSTIESHLKMFSERFQLTGKILLFILRDHLDDEVQLEIKRDDQHINSFKKMLVNFNTLKTLPVELIRRFRNLPLSRWPKRMRHLQLCQQWSRTLANRLSKLDCSLGPDKTDRFLKNLISHFDETGVSADDNNERNKQLDMILKNLSKYSWLLYEVDSLMTDLGSDDKQQKRIWKLLQDENAIQDEMTKVSRELNYKEIIRKLKDDNDKLDQELLLKQMEIILKQRITYGQKETDNWLKLVHGGAKVDIVDFLSTACFIVNKVENYYPRDTQLVAVLVLACSSDQKTSCMAEIATGEGKTLVSALLAIYLALSGRISGSMGCVNVVTSSPVLAEENVSVVNELFNEFGVSVGNNCDNECSEDEDIRRNRYKCDVIYGDLSSFQRDELIIRFFGRDVTRNRKAAFVVVDEVDSMLLDKGENILYLSHKIPELDNLLQVFVEIWQAIHAPDVMAKVICTDERQKAIDMVVQHIRKRIKDAEIIVPNCVQGFVDRQLKIWTSSALRAKYSVNTNDTYKLDDLRDGCGQQLVIMDKETGVEQVQMHWSHGLHQFLQLKHSLKLNSVSLKAVFMSNISYFNEFRGRLFGLTGTLGSQAECRLLHDVFNVNFLTMPRFKRRFCSEVDAVVAISEEQWLDNLNRATHTQLDLKKAVLIVCENIAAVDVVVKKLQSSIKETETCKIRAYISSFDKEFQKEHADKKLEPGDVIVATNLAGRGTDLKISEQLEKNGGLHVIISYMPANARVEAQAQGRTARAGQPGTYQFVINCAGQITWSYSDEGEDAEAIAASELQGLKEERDEREAIRLEKLGTRGLDKIKLEENLFERFRLEIFDPVVNKIQKEQKLNAEYVKIQLECLTNKWALWLDENSLNIEEANLKGKNVVLTSFEKFKKNCLLPADRTTDLIKYASTPTELVKLGRHFSAKEDEDLDTARCCYQLVIGRETNNCESALIHQAHLILQKQDQSGQKLEAKRLLIKAKLLIQNKMNILSSCSEIVKLIANKLSRTVAITNQDNESLFDEQIKNMNSLYNIHVLAIDDILGRPVRHSIDLQFNTRVEEANDVNDLIVNNTDLCKGFRLSKKVAVIDQEVHLSVQEQKKKIEWPSMWSYCQTDLLQMIREKITSKSYTVKQDNFQKVIITQQQMWDILTKENWFKEQHISYKWLFKVATKAELDVPKELIHLKSVVIDYLNKQNGQEVLKALLQTLMDLKAEEADKLAHFLVNNSIVVLGDSKCWFIKAPKEDVSFPVEITHCKTALMVFLKKYNDKKFLNSSFQQLFELDPNQAYSLAKFLEDKGVIVQMELCQGTLIPKFTSVDQLPENLMKFENILVAWLQQADKQQSGEVIVDRDSLPLPKDVQEGGRQLLNFLIAEGVIKEPALIFPKISSASKESVKSRMDRVQKVIEGLDGMKSLCNKYCPAPVANDYEPVLSDVFSYLRAKPLIVVKYGLFGNFLLIEKIVENGINVEWTKILTQERTDIKAWLKETKEKEQLDAYIKQIITTVTGSAGHLKTLPDSVSASFRNLGEYFTSGRFPVEVDDFEVQLLDRVIVLKEYKSWWDWQAFTVAMIGIGQVIIGVTINFVSAGVLSPIGMGFIAEGVNDIMFAIQSGLTGTFSWSAYRSQKMISAGITILTAGLSTYLTWSTAVAKTAMVGFRARCGLRMLLAAGKQILGKIAHAARSALIALGVEKLLAYLKKLIVENVFEHIRKNVVGAAAMGAIQKLTDAMDNIWKVTNGNVEESKRLIRTTVLVDATANCGLHSTWFNQLSGHSTQVGRAIGNTFAETTKELKFQNGFLDGVGQAQLKGKDSTGNDVLNLAKDVWDLKENAEAMIKAGNSAMKWIGYLKTGTEVATLITHAPEYVNNVASQLEQQVHTLIMKNEKRDYKTLAPSEEFNHFKSEMTAKVENDVLEHVMTRINAAWLQPLVQRKIESVVSYLGKQSVQFITSLLDDDIGGLDDQRERVKNDHKKNKSSKERKGKDRKKRNNDGSVLQEHPSEDTSYDDQVAKIGEGQMAGLLELQQVADYNGESIEIDDPTGTLKPNSKDGKKFTVKANGRESKSDAKTLRLKVSLNEDGTKHVSLTDKEGNIIYEGSPNQGLNRCLYDAAARAKGVSTEEYISGLKSHAINNERAKYLFDRGVAQAMPDARVGARQPQKKNLVVNNTTYEEVDVFCEGKYDKKKRPVKSDVWIKPENLKQGTKTNEKVRGPVKEENKKSSTVNQAGHFVPKSAGGSGTNPDNIYIQDRYCNQSENNIFDNKWKKFLNAPDAKKDNHRVNLVHELEYLKINRGLKPDFVTITATLHSEKYPGESLMMGINFFNHRKESMNTKIEGNLLNNYPRKQ